MVVRIYYRNRDGGKALSASFKVAEFACKDGSDEIKIDMELVDKLQRLRNYLKRPVIINSGYRTVSHNRAQGGSRNSQHLLGKAADIRADGIAATELAAMAEALDFGGIGLYHGYIHVDTRPGPVRWDRRSGKEKIVAGFGGEKYRAELGEKEEEGAEREMLEIKPMTVNGIEQHFRAILIAGENYINLRELVAALGGRVDWDEKSKEIKIEA